MKKLFTALAIFLLAGCSVGNLELVKKAAFCEINGESFQSGETISLADGCNFCVCSINGEIEDCTQNECEEKIGLANPAAVKCQEDDFTYEIREDEEGGQFGVCIDEAGSECDAWEYFRSECALGETEEVIEEEEVVEEEITKEEVAEEMVVEDEAEEEELALEEESEVIEEEIVEEAVVEEEVVEEEAAEEITAEI